MSNQLKFIFFGVVACVVLSTENCCSKTVMLYWWPMGSKAGHGPLPNKVARDPLKANVFIDLDHQPFHSQIYL